MTWESDVPEQPKDHTRLIYGGIFAIVVVMLGVMYFVGRPDPDASLVRVRHILVSFDPADAKARAEALETVNGLRERILKGEDFGRIAKEYSDDPTSSARGGDLGYVRRGKFVRGFEEYAWEGEIGELSNVIETEHGFHLIEVLERKLSSVDLHNEALKKRLEENVSAPEGETSAPAPEAESAPAETGAGADAGSAPAPGE